MKYVIDDNHMWKLLTEKLKGKDVEAYIDNIIEKYNFTRKSKAIVALLKMMLIELYKQGYIDRDLSNLIAPIHYDERERGALTTIELSELLKSHNYQSLFEHTFFVLTALCGFRRGEILALHWQDIDFNNNIIHIRHAWKTNKIMGLPKSGKPRITWLPEPAKVLLLALKEESYGNGLIFTNKSKRHPTTIRLGDSWVTKHFKKLTTNLNIDCVGRNITFHSLRHSLKSYLTSQGLSNEFQRMLFGWSGNTAEQMSRRYTHIDITQVGEYLKKIKL
jgi:integrase